MAKVEDLIKSIPDPNLRAEIAREVSNLKSKKKFGLVFEEHLPEQVILPSLPIKPGVRVVKRGAENEVFTVVAREEGKRAANRWRLTREATGQEEFAAEKELVVIKRFGEPIYPTLVPVNRVTRAPSKSYHTVINAENFHALQLLLYCYEGQVDVIYIDPPYNTGARDWKYNNRYVDSNDQYRHSKWLSMIKRRLKLAVRLLKPIGIMVITIDDYEMHHLRSVIEDLKMGLEVLGVVAIKNNPAGRSTVRGFAVAHEYALFIARSSVASIGRLERSDEQIARYKEQDQLGLFEWGNFRKHGGMTTYRTERPKQFYPIYVNTQGAIRIPQMKWDKPNKAWIILERENEDEEVLWPIDALGNERVWSFGHETTRAIVEDLAVRKDSKGNTAIYRKWRLNEQGTLPLSWWDKNIYSAAEYGTNLLKRIFGESQLFSFPKSLYAVRDCLKVAGAERPNSLVLDFFAGSGTTLHAVNLLNARDQGNRRCILITNNEVEEKRARGLNANGLWPGDRAFEKYGIAEAVTWPRCKYVVNGKRDNGTELDGTYLDGRELSKGFEENIEYLTLDFLDPAEVAYGDKFEAIIPILWLMAGGSGELQTGRGSRGAGQWFIPSESPYAVLIQENYLTEFVRKLRERPDITHVFLVTDSEEAYREMIAELPGSPKTKMLYKSYLENFRINTERNL
ncbi:MAG TPA: site-specific DNA-methyltransferase [Pyrinomonadaceae bacterium]|nr:site-specific DNA-methyltransferase [Pyrinomonadaceae bacterium]